MSVQLREADLVQDQPALIALARTHLAEMDADRFRWLYHENPFGQARAWLAFEGGTGTPIGMAALFPRMSFCDGAEVLGCVLGDFCVSPDYRSLGPALKLQRACLSAIESGQFAFCYDFPSRPMVAVYRHLGLEPRFTSVRMAKLLRTEEKVRQILPMRTLSRAVAKAADFALRLRDGEPPANKDEEYRLDEQPCSEKYLQLARRVGSSLGCCTFRSPEYLNWRYRRHPSLHYEFLTVSRGDELQAYCIFTVSQGRAHIVDLFGVADDQPLAGLIRRLVKLLRSRGASVVSLSALEGDPRTPLLRSLGFSNRDSAPVIGCGARLTNLGSPLLLMHGDRES